MLWPLWPSDGKVEYDITGNVAQFEQDIAKTKNIAAAGFSVIQNTGEAAMKKIGIAATAVGTALVKGIKDAIATGGEFDSAMSQVAATLGYSTDALHDPLSTAAQDFGILRDAALEYGKRTKFTVAESAEALNYMALAGYDAETSIAMLPQVLDLAAAGALDLGYASDVVTDAQTALGLSLDGTVAMIDQMARTASKTNTNVAQLAEAILKIGGTARFMAKEGVQSSAALGLMSEEGQALKTTVTEEEALLAELNTTIGVLASNGIKGAEAGTHLRNMLLKLAAPTKQGSDWMQTLGWSAFDASGRMKSMAQMFGELGDAMQDYADRVNGGNLTDELKLSIFDSIFNVRDLASANALLNTSAKTWRDIKSSVIASAGAAKNMADVQLDNLEGDTIKLQSAWSVFQVQLSDGLNPTLRDIVQTGLEMVNTLSRGFETGGLSGLLTAIGDVAGQALLKINELLPVAAEILMSIIRGMVSALHEHREEILQTGLEAMGYLIEGMREIIPEIGELVRTFAPLIVTAVLESKEIIWELGFEILTALIAGIGDNAEELRETAVDLLRKMMEACVENIPIILDAIAEIFPEVLKALVGLTPDIMEAGVSLMSALVENIDEITENICEVLPDLMLDLVEAIIEHGPEIAQAGFDLLTCLFMNTGAIVEALLKGLWKILTELWADLKDTTEEWSEVGADWIAGLWEGIRGAFQDLVLKVNGFFKDLIQGAKDILGIHSPSKVFEVIGTYVDEGLAEGIEKAQRLPEAEMTQVVRRVLDAGDTLSDLAGSYSFTPTGASPNFNIANHLTGSVEMDGFQVGTIVLRNLDDAAAFTVQGT